METKIISSKASARLPHTVVLNDTEQDLVISWEKRTDDVDVVRIDGALTRIKGVK